MSLAYRTYFMSAMLYARIQHQRIFGFEAFYYKFYMKRTIILVVGPWPFWLAIFRSPDPRRNNIRFFFKSLALRFQRGRLKMCGRTERNHYNLSWNFGSGELQSIVKVLRHTKVFLINGPKISLLKLYKLTSDVKSLYVSQIFQDPNPTNTVALGFWKLSTQLKCL